MTSCLGLYVESNVIKYAKISKDRDNLKVESFGLKFYDKLGDAIKQIISETYSFKVPISINLADEVYSYFYMFSMLNKKDLKKAIETEYEAYCTEKGLNKNAVETRYALVNSLSDKDRVKVIHVAANKNNLNAIEQQLAENKIAAISPIGMTIANIAKMKQKENIAIINMEDKTTVTIIVNQKVYSVDTIENGSSQVLDGINAKENSYSKAYEICKNSTIYTMEGQELQDTENEYLDNIMPTLYKIAENSKKIIENSAIDIDRIYITGTLSVVNNIDLYFQEFFNTEKCEILKPFFIKDSIKVNIKDYVEVNSAIAMAMQGLGYGVKDMNFKKHSITDNLPEWMTIDLGSPNANSKIGNGLKEFFSVDWKAKLDTTEKWLLRVAGGFLILVLLYTGFTIVINNQYEQKTLEANEVRQDTMTKLAAVNSDINSVKAKTNQYLQLADNLRSTSEKIQDDQKSKNAVTTMLSEIMYIIPKGVQLTSVENTTGSHIVINAQSEKYEQLGYFKVKIANENILKNSVSRLWIRSSVSVWKSSHHIVLLTPEAIPFMILFIMRYPMLNIPETADVIPRQTAL